jgi:ribosomal subunit interface protein
MQVIVSGKHVDVGESLRAHIESKLAAAVSKYVDRVNTIKVVVSKEGHDFRVDISGNLGTHSGLTLQSRMQGADAYVAFDNAAEKIEKQLRRYKRQITNHHNSAPADTVSAKGVSGLYQVISSEDEHEEVAVDNPLVIAENATHIEHLTVSDAVMRMDLGELPALLFINAANEKLNMLYRRADGNIAWVSPNVSETTTSKAA